MGKITLTQDDEKLLKVSIPLRKGTTMNHTKQILLPIVRNMCQFLLGKVLRLWFVETSWSIRKFECQFLLGKVLLVIQRRK